MAQRKTDNLDRGVVAVKKASGVFISWRIQADEYYDVKYNVYRNGTKLNSEPLNVSNYTDNSGTATNTYTVASVVNGVEGTQSEAVSPWDTGRVDKTSKTFACPAYFPIKVADVTDRAGNVVWKNENGTVTSTQNYTINDIALGDVDGDGKIDFIVKRKNQTDQDNLFPTDNTTAFCRIEVYTSKKNYQLSWYIDCGPNTVYGSDEQWDAVAFDWDQDGKCEVLYRAYGNTIIHKADGSTALIGSSNENIRAHITHTANMTFTNCGTEYLVYMNGETGAPYTTMEYPLKRLESSEYSTSIDWSNASDVSSKISGYLTAVDKAWGDGYGHRSSKYFMGAPYLDGRNPSIYLARGIYTRHKMIAYDVNPTTHALTQKWTWNNNTSGSDWYAQGYHNYCIADVDEDGCDEIVYGSMVIDNNGKGLSTTGLGHGDASHTGDLDPFRKGLETFACNEDEPGNNFRNAATCEIYYRHEASSDDGRSMAGNFSNDYPGSWGASASDGIISLASDKVIEGITNNWNQNSPDPIALNFRIYWDGDLLEETVNGPGNTEGDMFVDKLGTRIMQTSGVANINGTKKNPCAQGDIIGDWREELIYRSWDNTEFRIYSTTDPTEYRIPSLWYDHQYRQAMVWQTEGYNQPPHTSFFLGELEGITKAPIPYTMAGRTEITSDGGVIPTSANGSAVIAYGKSKVGIPSAGAAPSQLIINTPSTVSGNDGNGINYSYSTTQLGVDSNKGDLTGNMHLVKQGDGLLKLTAREFSYTGNTDVYAGSLYFRGTLNSPVWMNRHTTLYTGGTYNSSVTMEYGSALYITKDNSKSDGSAPITTEYATANINTLNLHEGSRVVFDINSSGSTDVLNLQTLSIRKQNWNYGPQYLAPVFQFNLSEDLESGRYPLGTLTTLDGNLGDIILEGIPSHLNVSLVFVDGKLYLDVENNRGNYIGNEDLSTGWWSDFSDSYTIEPGYNYNFKFTNYGNSAQNYYNWLLVLANGSGHSTSERSDYSEYFVIRADNYGWGGTSYDGSGLSNNFNWDTFKTDMTEATVNMDVQFKDGIFTMTSTFSCKNGKTYNYSYTSKEITADNVTMFFTVDHSYMTYPVVTVEELEPENEIGSSITYDFTKGSTTKDVVYLTASDGYEKVGQSGWAYASTYTEEIGDGIAFARLATSSKMYGFCYRYSGLLCIGQSHTLTVTGLKDGTTVEVYTSANAISSDYQGNLGGTWTSEVNSDATLYTYNMTSDGDLNLQFAVGAFAYKIVVTSPSILTLQPKQADDYEPGIYESVTLNRNFKAGYSTLCVPFNTTVTEFSGNDSEAYVATLSGVETEGNNTTLVFTNGTEIKANQPYIIYLSKELNAPSFTDKPVFAENAKTVTVGGWSMAGNYAVGKDMEGFYGVANNATIKKGGSGSTLNGFTAYITGSASGAKIRFSNGEETTIENINANSTTSVTAIYTVNGVRISQPQKGINIVKMSDNSIRKIIIK